MSNLQKQEVDLLARQIAERLNAGGVTQRCVSLAYGDLAPDLRVNYEYGLVLGVDEFRQEQLYHLYKSYQHNRALHGYGTVYGLPVSTQMVDVTKVLITVGPGMAIDQYGRAIVIRHDQCARLEAWLAKQKDWEQRPAPYDGFRQVYVTLNYDECAEQLVPIAGQPCSSAEASQAPSRIRDAFNIQLSWDPPKMPAWDAVQRFAQLMADVEIVPGVQSDVESIITLVRSLDTPALFERLWASLGDPATYDRIVKESKTDRLTPQRDLSKRRDVIVPRLNPPSDRPRRILHLPAETARAELDRIFTIWTVEVRPNLQPNLSDPDTDSPPSEPAVLLASIAFKHDGQQITLRDSQPDYTGRPYLLHTQLMQELRLLSGNLETARDFATLQVRGNHVLRVWIHYPHLLPIATAALQLKSNHLAVTIDNVIPVPGAANVFDIVTAGGPQNTLGSGARLELVFQLNQIPETRGKSLLHNSDQLALQFIGYDHTKHTITVFAMADMEPRQFATLEVRGGGVCQLWIHYPDPLQVPAEALGLTCDGQALPITAVQRVPGALNRFKIVTDPARSDLIAPRSRVELAISLDKLSSQAGAGVVPLLPRLDQLGLNLVGRWQDTITVSTLADRIQATREFVTFETVTNDNHESRLILWFHPNLRGLVNLPLQSGAGAAFKVWCQNKRQRVGYQLRPLDSVPIDGREYASCWELRPTNLRLEDNDLLSFSFYTDRVQVVHPTMSLTRLITQEQMAFIGYNGNHWIRTYHQVNLPPQVRTGITIEAVRRELQLMPATPFVTINVSRPRGAFGFEFWFHLNRNPGSDDIRIADDDIITKVMLYGEFEQLPSPRPDLSHQLAGPLRGSQHNVFTATLKLTAWRELGEPRFLRFVFRPELRLFDAGAGVQLTLGEYIAHSRIKFEGYTPEYVDPAGIKMEAIVAYVRIPEEAIG